jgi:hypothetical protein
MLSLSIVNWQNAYEESSNFKNRAPTKWAFVKEFLDRDFYEELYKTFPKFDNTWNEEDSDKKLAYRKFWERDEGGYYTDGTPKEHNLIQKYDSRYSKSWNEFLKHAWSEEFIKKLVEVTGVEVNGLRHFCFMYAKKDCFQGCHIHNVSDKTLIVFIYFSKDWEKGDPGGTYLSDVGRTESLDDEYFPVGESKIVFEPSNLDNTSLFVLDGPKAAHGMRKITKDVERRAIQLTYEPFSTTDGWHGRQGKKVLEPIDL